MKTDEKESRLPIVEDDSKELKTSVAPSPPEDTSTEQSTRLNYLENHLDGDIKASTQFPNVLSDLVQQYLNQDITSLAEIIRNLTEATKLPWSATTTLHHYQTTFETQTEAESALVRFERAFPAIGLHDVTATTVYDEGSAQFLMVITITPEEISRLVESRSNFLALILENHLDGGIKASTQFPNVLSDLVQQYLNQDITSLAEIIRNLTEATKLPWSATTTLHHYQTTFETQTEAESAHARFERAFPAIGLHDVTATTVYDEGSAQFLMVITIMPEEISRLVESRSNFLALIDDDIPTVLWKYSNVFLNFEAEINKPDPDLRILKAYLKGVESLSTMASKLNSQQLLSMARVLKDSSLKSLDFLPENDIDPSVICTVIEALPDSLTDLKLSRCTITVEIATALEKTYQLKALSFLYMTFDVESIPVLVRFLQRKQLEEFSLGYTHISDVNLAMIVKEIPSYQLRSLSLVGVSLSQNNLSTLAAGLRKSQLTELSIGKNPIGDVGVKVIAAQLGSSQLKRLNLDSCNIGVEGVCTLAKMLLDRPPLESLSVRYNNLEERENELLEETKKFNLHLRRLECRDDLKISDSPPIGTRRMVLFRARNPNLSADLQKYLKVGLKEDFKSTPLPTVLGEMVGQYVGNDVITQSCIRPLLSEVIDWRWQKDQNHYQAALKQSLSKEKALQLEQEVRAYFAECGIAEVTITIKPYYQDKFKLTIKITEEQVLQLIDSAVQRSKDSMDKNLKSTGEERTKGVLGKLGFFFPGSQSRSDPRSLNLTYGFLNEELESDSGLKEKYDFS